jgi:hypothetical protein
MRAVVGVVLCVVVASAAPRADACSCLGTGLALPTDGATEVPTNLAWVSTVENGEVSLVNLTTSTAVPLIVDGRFARVVGLLDPNTRYTVGSSGHSEVTMFTTGPGPDLVPPQAPTIIGLGATDLDPDQTTTCRKPTYRLHGELSEAEAGGTVTILAGDRASTLKTEDLDLAQVSDGSCNPHFLALELGTTYDIELVAHDYAGNASEHTHVTLEMPDGCAVGGRGSLTTTLLIAAAAITCSRRRTRGRSQCSIRTGKTPS